MNSTGLRFDGAGLSIKLGSLSNRALLVNDVFDVALYAGSRVVSAVGMKPPHDGRSRVRLDGRDPSLRCRKPPLLSQLFFISPTPISPVPSSVKEMPAPSRVF
jgi:hypothetical protein